MKKTILKSMLLSFLLFNVNVNATGVNKHIEADRLMLKAADAVEQANYEKAIKTFEKLESLGVTLPDSYLYYFAVSLHQQGNNSLAKNKLDKYLENTGREGDFYRESLELYNKVEASEEQEVAKIQNVKARLAELTNKNLLNCPSKYTVKDSHRIEKWDDTFKDHYKVWLKTKIEYSSASVVYDGESIQIKYDYDFEYSPEEWDDREEFAGTDQFRLKFDEESDITISSGKRMYGSVFNDYDASLMVFTAKSNTAAKSKLFFENESFARSQRNGSDYHVTISLGVCPYGEQAKSIENSLREIKELRAFLRK